MGLHYRRRVANRSPAAGIQCHMAAVAGAACVLREEIRPTGLAAPERHRMAERPYGIRSPAGGKDNSGREKARREREEARREGSQRQARSRETVEIRRSLTYRSVARLATTRPLPDPKKLCSIHRIIARLARLLCFFPDPLYAPKMLRAPADRVCGVVVLFFLLKSQDNSRQPSQKPVDVEQLGGLVSP